MRAYERLLEYVKVKTPSSEENMETPSSSCQFELAERLVEEMKELGIEDAAVDGKCYVYGTIPATEGYENSPSLGFIAHMDTVSDFCDHAVTPVITENYDGKDLPLGTSGRTLSPEMFSHLTSLAGRTLITSDGTTLLGADDKAGIAEILTAVETIQEKGLPHGKLCIAFTPDEEIGEGAELFDIPGFGADFAYTVDGGELGGLEYENFNADNPVVTFHGRSVHTGSAKGKMKNALAMAAEWQQALPAGEKPEYTEGYEGFFHVYKITGDVETCRMHMLVRDHDQKRFGERKVFLDRLADFLNEKYGIGSVELEHHDVYYNMAEKIRDGHMAVVDLAREAMEAVGVTPVVEPIRGGTDGAQLSWRGLPCPNLFTGGANFHGRFEYLPIPSLVKACEAVVEIGKRGYRI